nr:glutamate-rich WD repeat-containing protein 1 [Tanacetum cinerariifolium]
MKNGMPSISTKVWQPDVDGLEEGEELQCDPSAYNLIHAFHIAALKVVAASLSSVKKVVDMTVVSGRENVKERDVKDFTVHKHFRVFTRRENIEQDEAMTEEQR